MNARERLFAVMAGKTPDRLPNLNILMTFAAREIGVCYADYCTDYRNLVAGNLACAEKYGIDILTVMSDAFTEGSDLGMEIVYPKDEVPYPAAPLIKEPGDLLALKPVLGRRAENRLNAIRSYKQKAGTEYPVCGWVEGCFAQSADLRGVNEFLMYVFDREAFLFDLLDFCFEQEMLLARAQIEAGADIIGVGDAICSVAGPTAYSEIAADYERRLLGAIQEMGAKTKLHICGNTQPLLPYIPFEHCDIVDIDWMVDLQASAAAAEGRSVLTGNYDPVAVVMDGSPEEIRRAVRDCAKTVGAKYATAAGCEIPRDTNPENLLAIHEAVCAL